MKKNKAIFNESLFETIYNSSGCALIILSADGRFISGNREALKMFGCGGLKKFTNCSFYDLSPKKQQDGALSSEAADKFIAQALKNGDCKFEWLHKKIRGKKFFANVMLNRMKAGTADVLVAAIVDITEKKAATAKLEAVNEQLLKTNHSLQRMALVDSHTGLFNHRYMAQTVESEFFRAKRILRPLGILMLDIDYFKSINDVYGHKYGDMILKEFAEVLQGEVRKYDVVARFGGEEFVIILPGASRKTAFALAQRVLGKLAVYYFGWTEQKIKIKVSIGAAAYP
ncbi:MAG: sensor domain-containing diguanylate cyclase, partial [Elusimicrobiota bacterium]|nr:sensor domain-containing diguanylate cyclase [Elusimicrobiota bacterium]